MQTQLLTAWPEAHWQRFSQAAEELWWPGGIPISLCSSPSIEGAAVFLYEASCIFLPLDRGMQLYIIYE